MSKKSFTPVPMPAIGSIIEPMSVSETIAWWEKKERPRGKFVRIIWDAKAKTHSAVSRQAFTTGIVAFIVGRPPGFGDVLKIVSVGKNTCRVVAVNRYHKAAQKVVKIYQVQEENQESSWESIDIICNNVMEMPDIIGVDIAEFDEKELLRIQAILSWGVLNLLEHGEPPEYKDKDEQVE